MNEKNLDKALDIVAALMMGESVGRNNNSDLYEEYGSNNEVNYIVSRVFKKLNISLYEYNYSLYITAGDNNRIFGYTNEELKKELGLKLNKELYLCYFIIYNIITKFYSDAGTFTYTEYVKSEDIVASVDGALSGIVSKLSILTLEEAEEDSFKELALLWEDMPTVSTQESAFRASRGSKAGIVKLVFNFLLSQDLMIENEGRYYPKERFKAVIENYFESYKGRLTEIIKKAEGGDTDATHQ